MNTTIPDRPAPWRAMMLIPGGIVISVAVLALLPLLLRQTSFQGDRLPLLSARLIPLAPEERFQTREEYKEPEPEPPPPEPEEPEIQTETPEAPELAPPEIEPPRFEPPRASLDPVEMEPPPSIRPQVQPPSITAISVNSLPVRSSSQHLKLSLQPNKVPMPRALPRPSPPAEPPDARVRFNLDEVDRKPTPVTSMRPIYPFRARRLSIEGYVKVRFLVDRDGSVRDLSLLEGQPKGVFDKSVRKTVPRWRFKPAMKNGQPVETWVKTTIRFQLEAN